MGSLFWQAVTIAFFAGIVAGIFVASRRAKPSLPTIENTVPPTWIDISDHVIDIDFVIGGKPVKVWWAPGDACTCQVIDTTSALRGYATQEFGRIAPDCPIHGGEHG